MRRGAMFRIYRGNLSLPDETHKAKSFVSCAMGKMGEKK